jgi:hypothetical protein
MATILQNEPITEILLWEVGPLKTTYGDDIVLTPDQLLGTYNAFLKLERRLSMDVGHNAGNQLLPVTSRTNVATFVLKLSDGYDKIFMSDIRFNTKELEDLASSGQFGAYISPDFCGIDKYGEPNRHLEEAVYFSINRVSLTDNPATIGAGPIIQLSRDAAKSFVKLEKRTTLMATEDSKEAQFKSFMNQFSEGLAKIFGIDISTAPAVQPATSEPEKLKAPKVDSSDKLEAAQATPPDEKTLSEETEKIEAAKKLAVLQKRFGICSSDQLEGKLAALQLTAKEASAKLTDESKKLEDLSKQSAKEKTEANIQLAIAQKKISPHDAPSIQWMRDASPSAQEEFLANMPSLALFEKDGAVPAFAKPAEVNKALSRNLSAVRCAIPESAARLMQVQNNGQVRNQ